MADSMKEDSVAALLKGIDRYNPENLPTLEHYVQMQAFEQTYNLDANLAVLKLYQFNPNEFKETVTCQILLKALMNLPNTDFVLCKCLIIEQHQSVESVNKVIELSNLLETCEFQQFWQELAECDDLIEGITGFKESIRNFIASVLHITYESISKELVKELLGNLSDDEFAQLSAKNSWGTDNDNILINNQEAHIKSKSISEKISFEMQITMSNNENKDSLSSNPFAALFPNLKQAQQYVEASRVGLETSANKSPSSTSNSRHKNDDLPSKNSHSIKLKKISLNERRVVVNEYLQRVFLITINCDSSCKGLLQFGGLPPTCIKLEGLIEEVNSSGSLALLSEQNLGQALMERLQLNNPSCNVCVQSDYKGNSLNAAIDAQEEMLVKYLFACYKRLAFEENSLLRKVEKDRATKEEIISLSLSCRKLISSFAGSILMQQDIFPTEKPHLQLYAICLYLTVDIEALDFLKELVEIHKESNELMQLFEPVFEMLLQRWFELKLLDGDVHTLVEVLIFFSKNKTLAWMMIGSTRWLPVAVTTHSLERNRRLIGMSFATQTILGHILRLSSIPERPTSPPEHFLEPSRQGEAEMNAITNSIRQQCDLIVGKVHELLYNLIQYPDIRHEVLYWIGMCLHANSQRSQMYMDFTTVAPCGFFLNLNHVLLKFCFPFLLPSSKLLLKIDCRYGAASVTPDIIRSKNTPLHCIGLNKTVPMAQKPNDIPPVTAQLISFRFTSEIFYLTQQCYKLGVVMVYEKYQQLMKKLQKMSMLYQEARQQGAANSMIEELKDKFENHMRLQLAIKAVLNNPTLSDLSLQFCVASAYWLVQQTLANRDYLDTKPRELKPKFVPNETPPALTVIPEFFVENIGDTVRMMGYFNEDALERSEYLQYIMEFFAVFLGSADRIKNPHLRAKLAESLAAFLPKDRSSQTNLFAYSFRKNAFEKSTVVPKILPNSLLQLFVDIEFTGHAMQFEQKFIGRGCSSAYRAYRHYMYGILEYIWNMPSYHSNFKKLYEEGKIRYKRDMVFSAFPRFINLLMNDSTFLLDEALQNLAMIKTLEKEKENNEWENLSTEERETKKQNLMQFGHFAKGYNTMANETVHVLCYITRDIPRPFASPCMVDGMAAFLNYFLLHLVGPKRKELKVSDFQKYNFEPQKLVVNIVKIYLSLGKENDFCRAVAKDTRSFSFNLFDRAIQVVQKMDGCHNMADDLKKMAARLNKWHSKLLKDEQDMPEPPEEFIDPISCMLMHEPVQLPSSGKILCKSTITKHLLSDEKDPFNRSPLRLDQVVPCLELQTRIHEWMAENNVELPMYTSDDCGG